MGVHLSKLPFLDAFNRTGKPASIRQYCALDNWQLDARQEKSAQVAHKDTTENENVPSGPATADTAIRLTD